jgi:hypothetical protein
MILTGKLRYWRENPVPVPPDSPQIQHNWPHREPRPQPRTPHSLYCNVKTIHGQLLSVPAHSWFKYCQLALRPANIQHPAWNERRKRQPKIQMWIQIKQNEINSDSEREFQAAVKLGNRRGQAEVKADNTRTGWSEDRKSEDRMKWTGNQTAGWSEDRKSEDGMKGSREITEDGLKWS